MSGFGLELPAVERWSEPVCGKVRLDDIARWVSRFVIPASVGGGYGSLVGPAHLRLQIARCVRLSRSGVFQTLNVDRLHSHVPVISEQDVNDL